MVSHSAKVGNTLTTSCRIYDWSFCLYRRLSIVNSGANDDHDCPIGNSCHLAPQAAFTGEIIVVDNIFIGTNATIWPRLRIGAGSIIGAGAVVTRDVRPGAVVVGNPAKPLLGYT